MHLITPEQINGLLDIDDSYKAPDRLMSILFNKAEREKLFRDYLEIETNVDYDWFHEYFQNEHADRKNKKQDFTPRGVATLLSKLVNTPNVGYTNLDIAAGTGGLTIEKWNEDRYSMSIFEYLPSMFFYQVEELSDRAIPFLIFNLAIRGMNATVVHGDSLLRKCKGIFFIQNDKDDFLGFSSINVMPYNETTENEFHVEFGDFRYPEHIESPIEVLDRLGVRIDGGQVKGIKTEG